jgi:hypothetical protein
MNWSSGGANVLLRRGFIARLFAGMAVTAVRKRPKVLTCRPRVESGPAEAEAEAETQLSTRQGHPGDSATASNSTTTYLIDIG